MQTQIHVVGAGLSGLVAAVTAAEAGAEVTVYERGPAPGRDPVDTADGAYVCDPGPHCLYADGVLWRWFAARDLLPDLVALPWSTRRFVRDGALHRTPHPRTLAAAGALAATSARSGAPHDRSFLQWARRRVGARAAAELALLATAVTWHPSPGDLPAERVWMRLRRQLAVPAVTWTVRDGWRELVGRLAAYAQSCGVLIAVDHELGAGTLPPRPVVLATGASGVGSVGAQAAPPSTSRIVCVDVGCRRRDADPVHVTDVSADTTTPGGVTAAVVVQRPSASSTRRAPLGRDLLQAAVPVDATVSDAEAVARIEATLDVAFWRWRERTTWRRDRVLHHGDPVVPGDPSGGVFVAGDGTGAAGMLAEVAVNSAVAAARDARDWASHLLVPEGWPATVQDSIVRLREVAASLPAAGVAETVVDAPYDTVWREQPADEAAPGLRLRVDTTGVAGRIHGVAAVPDDAARTRIGVLVGTRTAGTSRLVQLLERLAQRDAAAIVRRGHT